MRRSLFHLLDEYPGVGDSGGHAYPRVVDSARRAEALGYDTLWLAEHHFQRLGTIPNPAVALAAVAASTNRIRLGPAVAILPLRDPTQVAEDYALVDVISRGRLNLGVGAGSQALEFAGFARDFDDRMMVFDAQLKVLRERWASAGGADHTSINVRPIQSSPPLYVATTDTERARALGRAGLSMLTIVTPAVVDLSEIQQRLEAHAAGLRDGGHPPEGAEAVTFVFTHVADSEDDARRMAAPALARVVGLLIGAEIPDGEPLYDMMRERDTGVFGSRESAAVTIARYQSIGARHVAFLSGFGGIDEPATHRSIELLAPSDRPINV